MMKNCLIALISASISYAKVDAKMDSIITEFCQRVTSMRETRGDLVESPAHARIILHGEWKLSTEGLQQNDLIFLAYLD